MSDNDALHRFLIESAGIRGVAVRLSDSWQQIRQQRDYPAPVNDILGEAVAAGVMMASTLKFDGSLIMQVQGDGPLHTLVAQATSQRTIRGLAHWHGALAGDDLGGLFGNGKLVLTLDRRHAERYQGIISLEGSRLQDVLCGYFAQSEQLPTWLMLSASNSVACGLMLQAIPDLQRTDSDGWQRMRMLASTLTVDELLTLPIMDMLHRLFHEERLRLYQAEPVSFQCSCSSRKIETTLLALGREEVDDILQQEGQVEVTCEFCNRRFVYDSIDIQQLFGDGMLTATPVQLH